MEAGKVAGVVLGPSSVVSADFFLLFDPKRLLGVGMHYLNDPLCFSQSGGCRRLINLTWLLFCTRWGQTHIAYSKPALRHPPFLLTACSSCSSRLHHLHHQIIIQIDVIVIYANEPNVKRWFAHNKRALCLTVIRFTTAYICTVVDGHGDVMMIFLTDLHALLIFCKTNQFYP